MQVVACTCRDSVFAEIKGETLKVPLLPENF